MGLVAAAVVVAMEHWMVVVGRMLGVAVGPQGGEEGEGACLERNPAEILEVPQREEGGMEAC